MNRANIVTLQLVSESLPWAYYREIIRGVPLIEHFLRWWTKNHCAEPLALVCTDQQELVPLREIAAPYNVPALHSLARAELGLLRHACEELNSAEIAVLPLTLPLLPAGFLERLWEHHASHRNAFTEVLEAPEGAQAYVASSELLDLLAEINPDPALSVTRAARAIRDAGPLADGANLAMEPFRFCREWGIPRSELPKRVMFDSRDEFALVADYVARASQAQSDNEVLSLLSEFRACRVQRTEQQFERFRSAPARHAPGPIRVLYVSAASGYSGAEDSLVRMIAKLDRDTVRPYACVSMSGLYTQRLAGAGATVLCPEGGFAEPRLPNLKYLAEVIAEANPDFVHINGNCGLAPQIAAALARVPVVQHLRSAQVREMADALALSAAVISVSEYVRRQVAESVDIDLAKVHVVYDGIDTDWFAPGIISREEARQRLGIPEKAKVVLMIARYFPNKRHDLLLRAFARVREQCPEAELCFVGEADRSQPAYFDRIQRTIAELRLEDSVRCLGFQRDIRWVECAADVQCLCSEQEPLGICILESMALGIPAVVSGGSALSEVITDGETGFVVPHGETPALAARLLDLLGDAALRQRVGRQARRLIESRFTARACAENITAIYERICLEHRAGQKRLTCPAPGA